MRTFAVIVQTKFSSEILRSKDIVAEHIIAAQKKLIAQLTEEELDSFPSYFPAKKNDTTATVLWRNFEISLVDEESFRQDAALLQVLLKLKPKP